MRNKIVLSIAVMIFTVLIFIISYFPTPAANANQDPWLENAKSLVRSMIYVKDARTGLCFAAYHFYRHSAITQVPCSTPVKFHIVYSKGR